jgi:GNAT superfamily N-acetyltransferase
MREVARFEPPADEVLRGTAARFDCVQRLLGDGSPDPGEAMVRDFLRGGGYEIAAEAGTSTTYMLGDAQAAPGRLLGYVTLALSQIKLTTGERRRAEALEEVRQGDFGAIRVAMIAVDKEFHGQGHGKVLLDAAVLHTARINREVSVRFIIADAVKTQTDWYKRQGFVENRAKAEVERLERVAERTGVVAISMRLDLGPDPRRLLSEDG